MCFPAFGNPCSPHTQDSRFWQRQTLDHGGAKILAKLIAMQSDLIDVDGLREGDVVKILDDDSWSDHPTLEGIDEATLEYVKKHCHMIRPTTGNTDKNYIMYKGLLDLIVPE